MATQVGEAVIKLTFDGKEVKSSLEKTSSQIEQTGKKSGNAFGEAWTVAAGALIANELVKEELREESHVYSSSSKD